MGCDEYWPPSAADTNVDTLSVAKGLSMNMTVCDAGCDYKTVREGKPRGKCTLAGGRSSNGLGDGGVVAAVAKNGSPTRHNTVAASYHPAHKGKLPVAHLAPHATRCVH